MNAADTQITAEDEILDSEDDDDSYLTEEERLAIEEQEDAFDEEEDERRLSRFSRGCLEVAGVFAGLAALVLLLEQVGICITYALPRLVVPLTLAAGSLLALTTCLFSAFRKTLAGFVMIVTLWFIILVYCVTNFQFPEVIPTVMPETGEPIILTQITTPIGATLCVDEVLIPGVMSRRFKLPVHPKYIPFDYQIRLLWDEEAAKVDLYYNDQLWASYDPDSKHWETATRIVIEGETEETTETTTARKKR